MSNRPRSPRLAPVTTADLHSPAQELLSSVSTPGSSPLNIFATLVRHPGLFRRWLPFGGKLLDGKIPARDRELLILRSAWRCGSEYEWGQHVLIGTALGLTDDDGRRVRGGPDAADWDDFDETLLRAADELHDDSCISDATWRALTARSDERQLIEVPMLVGHYHLVAFALNSLGVQREPGVPGFDG